MPNEDLQPGASFFDVLETPEPEASATPVEEDAETSAATEGGTPPSESDIPGVLKDPEKEEEDETPDLSTDPDLEKHPILKAKMAEFIANKERGINKFIETQKAKTAELEAQYAPVKAFFDKFEDAETVDEAFKEACIGLARTYGRPFGGYDGTGNQSQPTQSQEEEGDPKSKYDFEFASDDKIFEKTVEVVTDKVTKLLDERLGPIAKKFETDSQAEAIKAKAVEALPSLQSTYGTAAEPWVTQELVEAAVREYPMLEPATAFRAKYADEIAKFAAKHSGGNKVRNMPAGESGGRTRAELRPGADFESILAAEATL